MTSGQELVEPLAAEVEVDAVEPSADRMSSVGRHMSELPAATFAEECVHLAIWAAGIGLLAQAVRLKEVAFGKQVSPLHGPAMFAVLVSICVMLLFPYGRGLIFGLVKAVKNCLRRR